MVLAAELMKQLPDHFLIAQDHASDPSIAVRSQQGEAENLSPPPPADGNQQHWSRHCGRAETRRASSQAQISDGLCFPTPGQCSDNSVQVSPFVHFLSHHLAVERLVTGAQQLLSCLPPLEHQQPGAQGECLPLTLLSVGVQRQCQDAGSTILYVCLVGWFFFLEFGKRKKKRKKRKGKKNPTQRKKERK